MLFRSVASEVNADSIHEIALFAPIAEHAVGVMDVNQRRDVARNLAIVVSDAAIRLDGQENFPWSQAAQAITNLDVCVALAATARWEDSGIVNRTTFLPSLLETALISGALSPIQVSSFLSFLDNFDAESIINIAERARKQIGRAHV